MKGLGPSCYKPFQVKGVTIAIHKLCHLGSVRHGFLFQLSNLLYCIPKFLDKSFEGLTIRRSSDMHSLNRIFLSLLFHLHGKFLVYLIRFLGGFSFTFLTLHMGFFFSFHDRFKVFHRGFIFPLQRYFSTFTLPFLYRGFLFLFHKIFNAFTLLLLNRGFW